MQVLEKLLKLLLPQRQLREVLEHRQLLNIELKVKTYKYLKKEQAMQSLLH
jgi:hypothetical protein